MQDVAAAAATKADVQITGTEKPCQKKEVWGGFGGALGEMVQEAIAWDLASLSSTFVRDDLIKDYEGKREREGERRGNYARDFLSLTVRNVRASGREKGGFTFLGWREE